MVLMRIKPPLCMLYYVLNPLYDRRLQVIKPSISIRKCILNPLYPSYIYALLSIKPLFCMVMVRVKPPSSMLQ
jgi:hypothetical protein